MVAVRAEPTAIPMSEARFSGRARSSRWVEIGLSIATLLTSCTRREAPIATTAVAADLTYARAESASGQGPFVLAEALVERVLGEGLGVLRHEIEARVAPGRRREPGRGCVALFGGERGGRVGWHGTSS